MIKVITSRDNPRVKYAASLKDNKERESHQEFLGESKKSLLMAIEAKLVKEVFTYEALDIDENITQFQNITRQITGTVIVKGQYDLILSGTRFRINKSRKE